MPILFQTHSVGSSAAVNRSAWSIMTAAFLLLMVVCGCSTKPSPVSVVYEEPAIITALRDTFPFQKGAPASSLPRLHESFENDRFMITRVETSTEADEGSGGVYLVVLLKEKIMLFCRIHTADAKVRMVEYNLSSSEAGEDEYRLLLE